ncbi:TRAP transporter substrate-binding protein [Oceanobacillus saliphilus]|uniref:TRAP transporter substrate-binding protein n=1 Tax=Oceanobacillus saliphilus TaxID=2925834 RepID=UPI00201E0E5E|nr:TRAP transporter substrate-binding protein [Oceanobacillus saliphilus]
MTLKNTITPIIMAIIFLTLVLLGNTALNTGAQSDDSDTIHLRLGQVKAASHAVSLGIDRFAELVEEKSDGEVIIETFHDGLIGNDREVIESAQMGSIDLASSSTPNMTSFTNYFTAWDLPYIFETKEEVYTAIDGEPGDIVREKMEENGFKVIFFPDYGYRQIVNNVRPVRVPEDMAGLKIRTTNSRIEQADFVHYGSNPTPVAWSEVFTALQQGTVEGEGNSYSLLWDSKHQEVLDYATEVNYNYSSDIVVMNLKIFNELSEEHQQIIMEAGAEATEWQRKIANENDEKAKQDFIDYGIEVYEPTDEEMREWKQVVEPVWDQFVVEGIAEPKYVEIILDTLGKTKEDIFE